MKKSYMRRKENVWLMIFVLPALMLFSIFVVYPFISGIHYSLYDWDGISPDKLYVGIENYKKLFRDKHFMSALWFTVKFTVLTVITQNFGALIVASLLDSTNRLKGFLRGVFFIPNVLSGVIVAFIWGFIFTKVLPAAGQQMGMELLERSWFSQSGTAFWSTIIVSFWLGTGYLTVIYLAGLSTVDANVVESAMLDGISPLQMLFRIKVPLILPSIIVGVFLITMNGLKQFEIVFLMTGGGPYRSTETLALLSYNTAYQTNNFGQAIAQAIIMFVLVAIVTTVQLAVLKGKEVES